MGYSEGGYASLAAAQELEAQARRGCADPGFILSGTVCMGAPYDLVRNTLQAFLGEVPSNYCFYMPYLVLGYQAVYGRIIDPLEIFAPVLLESRDDGNVLQWAAGGMDLLQVEAALTRRLGAAQGQVVLRRLFNPAWTAAMLDRPGQLETALGRILRENDLAQGWAPTRPILLAHSPEDRDVPAEDAIRALGILGDAVRQEGRDPSELLALRLLGEPGEGVGHLTAAVPGLVVALQQIDAWRTLGPEEKQLR
jgi:hypothetical protein